MKESETPFELTEYRSNGTITRKDHSHPAAYALLHHSSEKIYAGSTEDLYSRINQHRTRLMAGEHKNRNLQEAFDRDPNFSLAFVKTETKEEAIEIEQKIIDRLMPVGKLLNISPDARVANKGVLLSDEKKAIIREKTIEQFAGTDAREAHREISKNLWADPEYREKQRTGMAKVNHVEVAEKISSAMKERWKDPEYIAKVEATREEAVKKRMKPVMVDGVIYPSVKEAIASTDMCDRTIRKRIKSTSEEFNGYSFIVDKGVTDGK